MNDAQKLLEMIAAAQGSKGANAPGSAIGSTGGPADGGALGGSAKGGAPAGKDVAGGVSNGLSSQVNVSTGPGPGGSLDPSEAEMYRILTALTSFGQVGAASAGVPGNPAVSQELSQLPVRAQDILKQALAELAAKAPNHKPDQSVLIQLAEHLAIRFALERFERGEVKVNAVRQMLDRMNGEIDNLRKILGAHEDKMSDAGLLIESHREIVSFGPRFPIAASELFFSPRKPGAFLQRTFNPTSTT